MTVTPTPNLTSTAAIVALLAALVIVSICPAPIWPGPVPNSANIVQFLGIAHMEAAEHVLQYLSDTWNQSITYTRGSQNPNELWGWVDADWAGKTDTRRSHTSYILTMNGRPISCKSRCQDKVSLSTSEAEFVAASQAGQEALYLPETLKDIGYPQQNASEIYEDNLACVAVSENPVRRKFSRHIHIRRYFVRELVKAGFVNLVPSHTGTHKMVADALTKSLPSPAFIGHRRVMMGQTPFCFEVCTPNLFILSLNFFFP